MLEKFIKFLRRKVITYRNVQTFLLIILCCWGFVVINNSSSNVIDGVDNNYGIDCDELREVIQKNVTQGKDTKFVDITYSNVITVYDSDKPNDRNAKIDLVSKMRPLLNCLDPDEMYLSDVLKKDYFVPPARRDEKYVLENEKWLDMKYERNQQALDVMQMVYKNNLTGGFFVEAGAADCEFSVSLPLEHNYNWTGVLIETTTTFFNKCKKKRRKSYLLNHCLGTQTRAHFTKFNFYSAGKNKDNQTAMAGFSGAEGDSTSAYVFPVQCFNLESILQAAGKPTVNLFILDIEGWELAVLRSINWDHVDIEVLSVETGLAGELMKDSSPQLIIDFLKDKGYTRFKHREGNYKSPKNKPQNDMFVRNDIVQKYNVVQLL